MRPTHRPANPCFGSGPTAKRPGWSLACAGGRAGRPLAPVGRRQGAPGRGCSSARAPCSACPTDYRIGIVPGSDTGAFEMAMWSLLGAARRRRAGLGELRPRLAERTPATELAARGPCAPSRLTTACCLACPAWPRIATWCSPGTAPPRACACPTATGSPSIAPGSPCAMPPRRPSPWRCPGTSSTSPPTPGRRCSAARRSTAC